MSTSKPWVPDRRDMIWIDFNPQVGGEMKDEHPMLVLSTKAFNERTGIVIGLPMTHAQSNETNPFAVFQSTQPVGLAAASFGGRGVAAGGGEWM